jgi:hypothetical protein
LVVYGVGDSVRFTTDVLPLVLTALVQRIATDLNLHHASTTKGKTEAQQRELLNKTRVWLICFNLDRSTATQFGKPTTIKEDLCVSLALFLPS